MSHRTLYWIAVPSYLGLFTLLVLWITLLHPPTQLSMGLSLGLAVIPLLFPLKGLLQGKPYTNSWTPFLMLLYFCHGVMEAYANASPEIRVLASLELTLSTLVFMACTLYVTAYRKAEQHG